MNLPTSTPDAAETTEVVGEPHSSTATKDTGTIESGDSATTGSAASTMGEGREEVAEPSVASPGDCLNNDGIVDLGAEKWEDDINPEHRGESSTRMMRTVENGGNDSPKRGFFPHLFTRR